MFGALLALLLALPLPWGSHVPWATDLFVAVAALLLSVQLGLFAFGRSVLPAHLPIAPFLWWALWLAWIAAQLVPMDSALLSRLSPAASALVEETTPLLDHAPAPRITIAATLTVDAWLLTAGYAALYVLVVLTCSGDERRMSLVLGVVAASGVLQAVYAGVMVLSGLEWGFFAEKRFYRGVATGTFVNRNHLAGYLSMTAAAALGLILADLGSDRRRRNWRQRLLDMVSLIFSTKMRARLALVLMVIALVLTRSRMGNIAFFTSLCICGMGFIFLRHRQQALPAFALFASIVAVDILIVSNWYGIDRVVERIEQTDFADEGRATFLGEAPAVIESYALVGSGLGTFALAYAPFRSEQMREHFDHAHNDYIEFVIETGGIGAALLAAFVLAHALHAARVLVARRRRLAAAVSFAALMALVAQAIHATAEFNLQIPANAATLLTLLALAACWSARSRSRRRRE